MCVISTAPKNGSSAILLTVAAIGPSPVIVVGKAMKCTMLIVQ